MKVKGRKIIKREKKSLIFRKKFCRFCQDKNKVIDYKDFKTMEMFVKERGKILSSRITGNCAKHQRRIAEEIKKARFMALVPYTRV